MPQVPSLLEVTCVRIAQDREVKLKPEDGTVLIRDRDSRRIHGVIKRARHGPLVPYTVPMRFVFDRHHLGAMATRTWVEGLCPVQFEDLAPVLAQLHKDGPVRPATRDELFAFYDERRQRALAVPHDHELCEELVGLVNWNWLIERDPSTEPVPWGSWHGDPTVCNAIITRGGRVVLIDHSPQEHGPQEYDWAKLHVSVMFREGGSLSSMENVPDAYRQQCLAVLIGMIGSHGPVKPLVELVRKVAG